MKLNELEDFPKLGNTIVLDGNVYVKKREPLSDDEISKLWGQDSLGTTVDFARAIEKAHVLVVSDE